MCDCEPAPLRLSALPPSAPHTLTQLSRAPLSVAIIKRDTHELTCTHAQLHTSVRIVHVEFVCGRRGIAVADFSSGITALSMELGRHPVTYAAAALAPPAALSEESRGAPTQPWWPQSAPAEVSLCATKAKACGGRTGVWQRRRAPRAGTAAGPRAV